MNFDNWKHIYSYVESYLIYQRWIEEKDMKHVTFEYLDYLLHGLVMARHSLMCAYFAMLEKHGIEAPEHETFTLQA